MVTSVHSSPIFSPPFVPTYFITRVGMVIGTVPNLPNNEFPITPTFARHFFRLIAEGVWHTGLVLLRVHRHNVTNIIRRSVGRGAGATLVYTVGRHP